MAGIMGVSPNQILQAAQGASDVTDAISELRAEIYESLTVLSNSAGADGPGTEFNELLVKPMLRDTGETLKAVSESLSTISGLLNETAGLYAWSDQAASEVAQGGLPLSKSR